MGISDFLEGMTSNFSAFNMFYVKNKQKKNNNYNPGRNYIVYLTHTSVFNYFSFPIKLRGGGGEVIHITIMQDYYL